MSAFEDQLIPTPIQRLEREYPTWAESTSRLKTKARRFQLDVEREITYTQAHNLLARLEREGLNPVYTETVEANRFEPLALP